MAGQGDCWTDQGLGRGHGSTDHNAHTWALAMSSSSHRFTLCGREVHLHSESPTRGGVIKSSSEATTGIPHVHTSYQLALSALQGYYLILTIRLLLES